ncbi:hypothetical protein [Bdellovibrio sp. HCB337]|uniref:hypothetical protein n=1 Tax=Bdellovibrio sp. HCB337 TaxID=3394358 RepID=UPI0039A69C53
MKKLMICIGTLLLSAYSHAANFSEKVKINGFHCDFRGASVELRSLDEDRVLYLAENTTGAPEYFYMPTASCRGLIKNLGARLEGQVITANFQTEDFIKIEHEYLPRRPCRTKCDEDRLVEKENSYQRIETTIDGLRFFAEQKLN